MPTLGFPLPTRDMDLAQLAEYLAKVVKEIEWALANMDTKNLKVNGVDADRITARTITADRIAANAITANEIKANTITADRMNVDELSAITANLGHITAGLIEAVEIYGSYIATSTSLPRIEFSASSKLLQAYRDAQQYIFISPDEIDSPTLAFRNIAGQTAMFMNPDSSGNFTINNSGGRITIGAAGEIRLNPDNALQINGKSGFTGTFSAGTDTVEVTKGIITDVF